MRKITTVLNGKIIYLFCVILLLVGLSGCTMVGKLIPVENRISLAGDGSGGDIYKRGELTLHYSYRLNGNSMSLEGDLFFLGGADSLDVSVLFLDSAGIVISQKIVYSSGYRLTRAWRVERTFRVELILPPGTSTISFDYSAQPRSNQRL